MATGRYLLIAFSIQNKNTDFKSEILVSKAGSAGVNRSVSCLRGSPLAPNLRSCPCVAAALSGSPAFCAGSWRSIQIQTAHVVFKVRVSRIAGQSPGCKFSRKNKENRPAKDQRILSGTSGGKMVRGGCGAAVYCAKVACMGKRIPWEGRSVKRKGKCCQVKRKLKRRFVWI